MRAHYPPVPIRCITQLLNIRSCFLIDTMYSKLLEFKRNNNGSVDIPKLSGGRGGKGTKALRRWCISQCQAHTNSCSLPQQRVQKLEEVGFRLTSWDTMCEKLAAYKAEAGSLDVTKDENEELFEWTKTQRALLAQHFAGKTISLSAEQVQKLKSIGYGQSRPGTVRAASIIDADSAESKWQSMLTELIAYKERNGGSTSFSVKTISPSERALMYWTSKQREEYRKLKQGQTTTLTAQRLQRLNDIGLELHTRSGKIPWEDRIQALKSFAEENGHCRVPKGHELFNFVSGIRQRYKEREDGVQNSLTDERVVGLVERPIFL